MNAKVIGAFSGVGMLEHGFEQAGFDVVASNEVHPVMCQTLQNNFKQDVLPMSIHKLSVETIKKTYGRPDVIVGGFPCPTYSTAADIHSARACVHTSKLRLRGVEKIPSYSRYAELGGDLFLHYFRMVACLQPEVFVVENVPGLLAANIVRETFKNTPSVRGKLPTYYTLYEGILNAVDFGLPQDRPRYFYVGIAREIAEQFAPAVKSQRRKIMVGDILEKDPELPYPERVITMPADSLLYPGQTLRVMLPDYGIRRLRGETCRDRPIITEAGPTAIAPTVVAHYAKDCSTRLVKIGDLIRPYTPRECARLQGIPDDVELAGSDYWKYVQAGNAVALPVAYTIAKGVKEMLN